MTKFVKIGLSVVGLIIVACTVLVSFATSSANKLADEGNAAVEAGNKFAEQAGHVYAEVFTDDNMAGFPGNREQLAPTAQNLAELLAKAAEQYELAATKFDLASQKGVEQTVADYWSLKVGAFRKFAESKRSFRAAALLLLDNGVTTSEDFNEKLGPHIDEALKLDAESKELTAQGEALRAKHPDSFN